MEEERAPTFRRTVVRIPPRDRCAYVEAEWRDAIVIVASGPVELETAAGARRCFATGALVWFAGLGLVWIANPGDETAVLVAVSRRSPASVNDGGMPATVLPVPATPR